MAASAGARSTSAGTVAINSPQQAAPRRRTSSRKRRAALAARGAQGGASEGEGTVSATTTQQPLHGSPGCSADSRGARPSTRPRGFGMYWHRTCTRTSSPCPHVPCPYHRTGPPPSDPGRPSREREMHGGPLVAPSLDLSCPHKSRAAPHTPDDVNSEFHTILLYPPGVHKIHVIIRVNCNVIAEASRPEGGRWPCQACLPCTGGSGG